jgi:hypothetical protein
MFLNDWCTFTQGFNYESIPHSWLLSLTLQIAYV